MKASYPSLFPTNTSSTTRPDGMVLTTETVPVGDLVGLYVGLKNSSGTQVVPSIYGSIHNLYEGYYLTCKNTYGSFTADMGELVFDRETYNGI
ncbi:MAG: WG repeat-containing protein, partial [Eubacteriales bacterium]